jgi:hypothetical protein
VIMAAEKVVVPTPTAHSQAVADFTAWVADHHRPLLDFAQLVPGDASTAEDLLQTALARAGIIDLNTGEMALGIEEGPAQVGPHMVFDQAGRLNLQMGDPAHRFDVVVCTLAGEWWHSAARSANPIDFVLPNQQ